MKLFERTRFLALLFLAMLPVSSLICSLACGQPSPVITLVANAEGEVPTIAPNTWVEIKGTNLDLSGITSPGCAPGYCWQSTDFVNNQLPVKLKGISVTVNGNSAYVYYISPTQVDILTPPNPMRAQWPCS